MTTRTEMDSTPEETPATANGIERRVPSRPPFRVGPFSFVRRPVMVLLTLAMVVSLFLVACVNIGRGDFPLSIPQVVDVLFGGGANGMTVSAATSAGYTVVTDRASLQSLDTETATTVSGQFGTRLCSLART